MFRGVPALFRGRASVPWFRGCSTAWCGAGPIDSADIADSADSAGSGDSAASAVVVLIVLIWLTDCTHNTHFELTLKMG